MSKAERIQEELERQSQSSDRPDSKRMRDILPDIEASIARGVSRKKIHQILLDEGFAFTFESFLVTLARLRREGKKGKKPAPTVQQGAQAPPLGQHPPKASSTTASNPFKKLESEAKQGEYSAIPKVVFEIDNQN